MGRVFPFEAENTYKIKRAGVVPGDHTTDAGTLLITKLDKQTYAGDGVLNGEKVRFGIKKSWIYHIVNILESDATTTRVSYFLMPYADSAFVKSGKRVLVNGSRDAVRVYTGKAGEYIKVGGYYVDLERNYTRISGV